VAAATVLEAWESAGDARGHERALALAGGPESAALPLGTRDARLLRLFRTLRGPVLDALADCPACATTLELRFAIDELLAGADGPVAEFEFEGVRARCPTTADLMAVAGAESLADARAALIARCVDTPRALDEAELERVARELERLDPLVDVRVDVGCRECGHRWTALLDVPTLVWAQVQSAAWRLLREVDALAARYGWSEAGILALSQHRRHAYLDLP
jgi:hypothetical protein